MDCRLNREKAPWWGEGGIFERIVKSAKHYLKKVVGRNCLTCDELLTLVIEVEAVFQLAATLLSQLRGCGGASKLISPLGTLPNHDFAGPLNSLRLIILTSLLSQEPHSQDEPP